MQFDWATSLVNLISSSIFASPQCLHAVPDLQQVAYSQSSRIVALLISTTTADLSTIQKKNHTFIFQVPLRICFENGEDRGRAVFDDLKLEIANLKALVVTLEREWKFLSKGSLAARKAASRLTSAKPAVRLAFDCSTRQTSRPDCNRKE